MKILFGMYSSCILLIFIGLQGHAFGQKSIHTASANVSVLSDSFQIPRLGMQRCIWLYLPPDYKTSTKRYPVLYLHDGQNIFDAFYSYSGEWRIDETLDSLYRKGGLQLIIVAVENGGTERMNEYTPWVNQKYGGGKGDAYVDFLANTLKPYIDSHYRTLQKSEYTGVGGSSMGGLISLYAAAKYPEVFGRAMVFSPAFWVSPELYQYIDQAKLKQKQKLYFMAGAKESEEMVPDMKRMYDLLLSKGISTSNVGYEVYNEGEHREWFWAREFPQALQWLFLR